MRESNSKLSFGAAPASAIVRLFTCALFFSSCGGVVRPIAPTEVAGNYVATEFRVTAPDHERDLLTDGGSLVLSLSSGLALFGELHIPESEGEMELTRQITGVWTYDPARRTLRFQEQVRTFLSEMTLQRLADPAGIVFSGTLLQPEERLNHSSPITRFDLTLVRTPAMGS